MKKSIWEDSVVMTKFPKLDKDIETDVLIIGGGLAGILCGYFLKQHNIDYVICEAKTVGCGTTSKTTAVLSAQHDILYGDIIKKFSAEKAKLYLEANLNAIQNFRKICNEINCDFEICPSVMFSHKNSEKLKKEVDYLNELGFKAKLLKDIPLPVECKTAISFPTQAQYHPLKFLDAIAKKLKIYENTRIEKCEGTTAFSNGHKIFAKRVIVCSHFPIINSKGLYFTKLYQKRSFVLALENAGKYHGTFVDFENGFYFRNYKNYLIVGGGDHRTGKQIDGFKTVRDFAKKHFPNAIEKYAWATQDCMSHDNIAYIGPYSKNLPNVYVATGFNEWGMTTSMVAAEILSDMLSGKKNKYQEVFSPQRNPISKQVFANIGTTLLNFVTPTTKRCPHLGCALKWNKFEHTWDCSCHGSRFTEKGEIINNPTTKKFKV